MPYCVYTICVCLSITFSNALVNAVTIKVIHNSWQLVRLSWLIDCFYVESISFTLINLIHNKWGNSNWSFIEVFFKHQLENFEPKKLRLWKHFSALHSQKSKKHTRAQHHSQFVLIVFKEIFLRINFIFFNRNENHLVNLLRLKYVISFAWFCNNARFPCSDFRTNHARNTDTLTSQWASMMIWRSNSCSLFSFVFWGTFFYQQISCIYLYRHVFIIY